MAVPPCPLREQTLWVTNSSSRSGAVTLAALHESVGGTEAVALAKFTQRAGVSYHAIADNDKIVYCVPRSKKAWALRNGNPRSDNLCLCTPVAGYSRARWLDTEFNKVRLAGWWLAIVCADRKIDLAQCNLQNIRDALAGSVKAGGVTTHNDYTRATRDGTHTDPRNFPVDKAIEIARAYAGGWAPTPAAPVSVPAPPGAPAAPAAPRRSDVSLNNHPNLRGQGSLLLVVPRAPGTFIAEAYLSVCVDGGTGSAHAFAQAYDGRGISDWWYADTELANTATNGIRRKAVQVPEGTSHVRVSYDFSQSPGGGTIALETR